MKNFSKTYKALGDYEVRKLYVERESLAERGLTVEDLMPITYEDENEDYAEKPSIHLVDRSEMAKVIAGTRRDPEFLRPQHVDASHHQQIAVRTLVAEELSRSRR